MAKVTLGEARIQEFLEAVKSHDAAVTYLANAVNWYTTRNKTRLLEGNRAVRQSCRQLFRIAFGRSPTKAELAEMILE